MSQKPYLYLLALAIILLALAYQTNAQQQNISKSRYYEQAYSEIVDMLDGKKPLSIKRAVFLAEWAYFNGIAR